MGIRRVTSSNPDLGATSVMRVERSVLKSASGANKLISVLDRVCLEEGKGKRKEKNARSILDFDYTGRPSVRLWLVHASQQQIQKLRHKTEKLLVVLQEEIRYSLDTKLMPQDRLCKRKKEVRKHQWAL
eukprot:1138419-Pelagomonas_calceolata.AAC.1